jgi:ferritin-like metal-binding protein YciE
MNHRTRNYLEKWLKDAYAMEKSAIEVLENQTKRLKDYPAARNRVQQHLEESRWQCDEVGRCLQMLGAKPSAVKDTVGKVMGNMAAMTNASAEDETLKNFISNASFEHMEIASYRSLATAAQEYGYPQIEESCRKILQQEEAMASWCEDHIEQATAEFLSRHEAVVA